MKEYYTKICEYCGKPFLTKYDNKRFCVNLCGMAQWRENNPKECRGTKQRGEKVCGKDGMNRDRAHPWLKYMKENPEYHKMIGDITVRQMGRLL